MCAMQNLPACHFWHTCQGLPTPGLKHRGNSAMDCWDKVVCLFLCFIHLFFFNFLYYEGASINMHFSVSNDLDQPCSHCCHPMSDMGCICIVK